MMVDRLYLVFLKNNLKYHYLMIIIPAINQTKVYLMSNNRFFINTIVKIKNINAIITQYQYIKMFLSYLSGEIIVAKVTFSI